MSRLIFAVAFMLLVFNDISAKDVFAEKDFGCYLIPENFVESKGYSADGRYYYVSEKDNGKLGFVNSIAVVGGRTKYTKEEHAAFRDVVANQIVWQCQNTQADVSGDGILTKNGYIVYMFQIVENEELKRRYYIIDKDYSYVLIESTAHSDYEAIDKAAMFMVNTFTSR